MRHALLVGFVALLASCDSTAGPEDLINGPIQLFPLPEGSIARWSSELDSMTAVLRSADEWHALWAPASAPYAVPQIDFQRFMLLLVATGERGGHAWNVRIDSAVVARDTLVVHFHEHVTCATTGMMVRPVDVVAVERRRGVTTFRHDGVAREPCP